MSDDRKELVHKLDIMFMRAISDIEEEFGMSKLGGKREKELREAYEQIRQLIQQSESLMSIEESLALVVSILEDYEDAEAIQQKPEIDEAFVEKWIDRLGIKVRQRWSDDYYVNPSRKDLKQMLTEAGVKIR